MCNLRKSAGNQKMLNYPSRILRDYTLDYISLEYDRWYSPVFSVKKRIIKMIMRDVSNGWLIRYLHANTASAFFFLVYLHMGRGIYYGSYRAPRTLTWAIGTIIFIALVVTAFLGW